MLQAGRDVQCRLYRDALSTPWGFRLTGGKDIHAPLSVQRVAVGSPVDGEIHRGDVILEIQNQDATHMTHRQAQDAIRNAGGSLVLRVRRAYGAPAEPNPTTHSSNAYDYHPPHRAFMLGRLQDTLNSVVGYQPSSGYGSDYGDYYYSPTSPPPSSHDSGYYNNQAPQQHFQRSEPRYRPPTITALSDFGWTPQCLIDERAGGHGRRHQTAPPARRTTPDSDVTMSHFAPAHRGGAAAHTAEAPAWLGSLRSSDESRPSDQRAAGFQPAADESYRQVSAAPAAVGGSGGPAVIALAPGAQHLQYNSPLGLYSKSNVQQAISGQPGAANGTADSDLSRMVQENDRRATRRAAPAGRLDVHGADHDGAVRQSPSMRHLESQFVLGQGGAPNAAAAAVGITDF